VGKVLDEKLARLEGRIEELSKRLDDLRNDMNHRFEVVDKRFNDLKWEVRIWFLVLIALITILTFLRP
jgi:predicted  nucleic acid-binding Zn-ribbon protein